VARRAAGGPPKAEPAADAGPTARVPSSISLDHKGRLDPVAGAEARMRIVGAGDAAGFGVLADHVVGLPAGDVHQVVGGPARREPHVREGSAEAVRVDVLNAGLLATTTDHVSDARIGHVRGVVALDAEPKPWGRSLFMAGTDTDVPVQRGSGLLAYRHPRLVSALEADAQTALG
jgi:hypothetical protein